MQKENTRRNLHDSMFRMQASSLSDFLPFFCFFEETSFPDCRHNKITPLPNTKLQVLFYYEVASKKSPPPGRLLACHYLPAACRVLCRRCNGCIRAPVSFQALQTQLQPEGEPASADTGSHLLSVPLLGQGTEYPTGCEVVSATMLLQYWKISASVDAVIAALPKGSIAQDDTGLWHGPNPNGSLYRNALCRKQLRLLRTGSCRNAFHVFAGRLYAANGKRTTAFKPCANLSLKRNPGFNLGNCRHARAGHRRFLGTS